MSDNKYLTTTGIVFHNSPVPAVTLVEAVALAVGVLSAVMLAEVDGVVVGMFVAASAPSRRPTPHGIAAPPG
jgi:hypothetical protein